MGGCRTLRNSLRGLQLALTPIQHHPGGCISVLHQRLLVVVYMVWLAILLHRLHYVVCRSALATFHFSS